MTTIATPIQSLPDAQTACPWWCTAAPEDHRAELLASGRWSRLHGRRVGGFTMYATESGSPGEQPVIEVHPTVATFDMISTAADATELSESLHQVAAILRWIQAGRGQSEP